MENKLEEVRAMAKLENSIFLNKDTPTTTIGTE